VSRTSRRVSRPLIAVLAVVIILGAVFTIHKLKSAPAAEAKVAAPAQSTPAPRAVDPPAPPPQVTPAPLVAAKPAPPTTEPSHVVEPSHIVAQAPAPDSDALVTQTPTVMSPRPSTQPSGSGAALSPSAQARAELPDLSNRSADSSSNSDNTNTIPSDFLAKANATTPPPAAPPSEISNQPLQDARTKMDAGDLIASRQLLNDALVTGRLSDADADAAKKQIEDINKILVFSAKRFPNDPWGGVYQVASGERLATIAARNSVTWELLSRVNGVTPRRLRSGQNIKIFKGPFHAVVYKGLFKMEIYLGAPGGPGSLYITSFPVGLGKDNSTPTGLWLCKNGDKIRNPRYYPPHGGDIFAPDDPKNPLGGYWIAIEGQEGQALGKESYGIHGTIDPASIGKMESMGCIRLKSEDISWVFDLLVDGKSKVLVKD
jgi:hypothetical protein